MVFISFTLFLVANADMPSATAPLRIPNVDMYKPNFSPLLLPSSFLLDMIQSAI